MGCLATLLATPEYSSRRSKIPAGVARCIGEAGGVRIVPTKQRGYCFLPGGVYHRRIDKRHHEGEGIATARPHSENRIKA